MKNERALYVWGMILLLAVGLLAGHGWPATGAVAAPAAASGEPAAGPTVVGETGRVKLGGTIDQGVSATVNLGYTYANPVVVAFINTFSDPAPVDVRVRDVTGSSFNLFLEEPGNGTHQTEFASYIVFEAGHYWLDGGLEVEAGTHATSAVHRGGDPFGGDAVTFATPFAEAPAVLHTLNTYNKGNFMSSVAHNTGAGGFWVQQEAAETGSSVATETIGWIAFAPGSGSHEGQAYEVGVASDGTADGVSDGTAHKISFSSFSAAPDVVAKGNSGNGVDGSWARGAGIFDAINQTVWMEEDLVGDAEQAHLDESVAWAAFDPDTVFVLPSASLTIVKEATVEDGTDFDFTTNIPGGGGFTLDDEPVQSDLIEQQITFSAIPGATYEITEETGAAWNLASATCSGGGDAGTLDGETLSVAVATGEDVTCTFTNRQSGSITLAKAVNGPDADEAQPFEIFYNSSSGALPPGSLTISAGDGAVEAFTDLPPMLVQLREQNLPADWRWESLECTSNYGSPNYRSGQDGSTAPEVQFDLREGEDISCTWTNRDLTVCWVERTLDTSADHASVDGSAVQAAIDAATAGDTLKIAGSCAGVQPTAGLTQTAYIDKELTLQGGYTVTNWLAAPDPQSYPTLLDAQNQGRVVVITGTAPVQVGSLRLTGGTEATGGGVYVGPGASLTMSQAEVVANTATVAGGGLYLEGAVLDLSDVYLGQNTAGEYGGGLDATASLVTADSMEIDGNSATAQDGGGLRLRDGSTLTLTHSTVSNNTAGDDGAGLILNSSVAIVSQSSIISNSASLATGIGGGLLTGNSTLTVTASTLAANSANNGGGIYNNIGTASFEGVTFFANTSIAAAAVRNYNSGSVVLTNSTVSGHTSSSTAAVNNATSGAVTLVHTTIAGNNVGLGSNSGALDVRNSILANGTDCFVGGTAFTSGGYTISGDASCPDLNATGDLLNTNALLAPLADNGGPAAPAEAILTHALPPGSPAVGHVPAGNCDPTADQRGVTRPQAAACDSGAYERWPLQISALSPTAAQFDWTAPAAGCAYSLHESPTPYFTPPGSTIYGSVTSGVQLARLGALDTNYFFIAVAVCGEEGAYSAEVGEIDFALQPGN